MDEHVRPETIESARVDENEDFLDEMVRESTDRSPDFPELMERARRHREALRDTT